MLGLERHARPGLERHASVGWYLFVSGQSPTDPLRSGSLPVSRLTRHSHIHVHRPWICQFQRSRNSLALRQGALSICGLIDRNGSAWLC